MVDNERSVLSMVLVIIVLGSGYSMASSRPSLIENVQIMVQFVQVEFYFPVFVQTIERRRNV